MAGIYTVSFFEQTLTAANGDYDLFEIVPATDSRCHIVGLILGNKSEVGTSQEEMVSYSVTRFTGGTYTGGNGTSTTPAPAESDNAAATFTAETVGATVATTTGTTTQLHQDTFNIRSGLQLWFPREMRLGLVGAANAALVVRLRTALADDATISGTLYVREYT